MQHKNFGKMYKTLFFKSNRTNTCFFHKSKFQKSLVVSNNYSTGFNNFKSKFRSSKIVWFSIPVSLGLTFLGVLQLYKVNRRERERLRRISQGQLEEYPLVLMEGPWYMHFYSLLPLRGISRFWGYINEFQLPVWLRKPILSFYANTYECNLAEAKEEDLTKYENLAAFFFRELKEYARKVEYGSLLTSPSDGYVLYRGLIENGKIEHIKGFTYDMNALIGVEEQNSNLFKKGRLLRNNTIEDVDVEIEKMKSSVNDEVPIIYNNEYKKKDNLFYCVIYLAPGDYHRFHSPCDWKIEKRRHFTGELYSVSPKIVNTITNLFVLNERVVLSGKWEHGLFSFIPVGATNVGSIIINFDEELKTNLPDRHILDPPGTYNEKLLSKDVQQGEELGGFKLGSTIVLLFEAPKNNFKFDIVPGEHVKMGQRIAHLEK